MRDIPLLMAMILTFVTLNMISGYASDTDPESVNQTDTTEAVERTISNKTDQIVGKSGNDSEKTDGREPKLDRPPDAPPSWLILAVFSGTFLCSLLTYCFCCTLKEDDDDFEETFNVLQAI